MSIIRKEAYYSSSNGVSSVRALIWQDDEKAPIGVIQIAHGVSEHIGRYDHFARFLAENGFVVCGNDHLGHGKSVYSDDELGYVYDGDNVNMVRDMNTLHNIMSKRYPDVPYIIFGHSMGSFLARIYSAAFGDRLSGAIYCGTGQVPVSALMLEDSLKNMFDRLSENSDTPSSVVSIFQKLTKKVLKGDDDLSWISRNEENIENYKNDPLCGFKISTSLAKELMILAVKASDPSWASKLPQNLPVLLISGAKDPIGMFGKGVLDVADALVKVGIEPEVFLYPADRHEILNEEDNEKVYADVLTFVKGIVDGITSES